MARMLGDVARKPLCPVCGCDGYHVNKRGQRAREKREWLAWQDDYEPATPTGCPLDGLSCTCNKLPEECDPWRGETWPTY